LTAINQGDVIVTGDASPSLAWKIPLNYLTPFVVSTLGYRAAAHAGAGLTWRCGRRAARCRPAAASSRLAASARRKGSG